MAPGLEAPTALYGLRCAAAAFAKHLASILVELGFVAGWAAPSVFYRASDQLRISVHVDDPLFVGPKRNIQELVSQLGTRIAVKALEEITDENEVK